MRTETKQHLHAGVFTERGKGRLPPPGSKHAALQSTLRGFTAWLQSIGTNLLPIVKKLHTELNAPKKPQALHLPGGQVPPSSVGDIVWMSVVLWHWKDKYISAPPALPLFGSSCFSSAG